MAKADGRNAPTKKRSNVQIIPPPPKPEPRDPDSDEPKDPDDDESKSMCEGCAGWCCSLAPELTGYDVVRIAESEGKRVDEFVDFVESNSDDAVPFKAKGKMVKMTFKRKGSACMFFESKSPLKCSIHASKPAICITYPFRFLSKEGGMLDRVMCPAENKRRMDQALDTNTQQDAKWEVDRYTEIVEDWNARAKGDEELSEFLAFAAKEMKSEKTPLGSILRKIRRTLRMR